MIDTIDMIQKVVLRSGQMVLVGSIGENDVWGLEESEG